MKHIKLFEEFTLNEGVNIIENLYNEIINWEDNGTDRFDEYECKISLLINNFDLLTDKQRQWIKMCIHQQDQNKYTQIWLKNIEFFEKTKSSNNSKKIEKYFTILKCGWLSPKLAVLTELKTAQYEYDIDGNITIDGSIITIDINGESEKIKRFINFITIFIEKLNN